MKFFNPYFILVFIIQISVIHYSQAQNSNKETTKLKRTQFAVYAEIFGNAGLYSGNIDFTYFGNKLASMSVRAGIGSAEEIELSFPTELSLLIGKNNHYLETGVGMTFLYFGSFINVLRLGYKFQKRGKGLIIRAGITPYLDINEFWIRGYQFHGGVSIGYTF